MTFTHFLGNQFVCNGNDAQLLSNRRFGNSGASILTSTRNSNIMSNVNVAMRSDGSTISQQRFAIASRTSTVPNSGIVTIDGRFISNTPNQQRIIVRHAGPTTGVTSVGSPTTTAYNQSPFRIVSRGGGTNAQNATPRFAEMV